MIAAQETIRGQGEEGIKGESGLTVGMDETGV
jgi:hypothetical protein